ncbi:PLC-like phosphodiesterase [Lineolata rhizophorae]|uniref:PLC-like phosphodiesterase n=1 Tax=Lineolata rhizophorae TaxID=578093 RepID=A0A6A6NQS6_9PEZI|nr:PLC-like phosphodiesterase [Lineolata rhizophorae]
MLFNSFVKAFAALPLLWQGAAAQTSAGQACNNSPDLCDRPYSNITFLGAHDSAFIRDESTGFSTSGNQFYNTTVQLNAGVRLLSAQLHATNSSQGNQQWHLCHSSCQLLDAGQLREWLAEIKDWMDANPNDVVTVLLVNADAASAQDIHDEYVASGITQYVYQPQTLEAPQSWPTLGDMIAADARLVSFVATLDDAAAAQQVAPYLMNEFDFVFENDFDNDDPADFSCDPARPSQLAGQPQAALDSDRLFLMNHFLYESQAFGIEIPDVDNLGFTNAVVGDGSLGQAAFDCTRLYGAPPSFLLVDFFNVGPAINTADAMNSINNPVGRAVVSSEVLDEDSGSTGAGTSLRASGSTLAFVLPVAVAVFWHGSW